MTSELATTNGTAHAGLSMWDQEQIEVIKSLICPGASDAELKLFAQVCGRTGLDPFSRQIYGLMRSQNVEVNGEWKTVQKLSIQTGIDGFRLQAERSGKYGGQLGPQWCGPDGKWLDVWLSDGYPSAARVGVIRTDWTEPLWAVARWVSYAQTTKAGKVTKMWDSMPDLMLGKVAEALALRRAFPAELSGLYTEEEMAQADSERPEPRRIEAQVVSTPKTPEKPEPSRKDKEDGYATLSVKAIEEGIDESEFPILDRSWSDEELDSKGSALRAMIVKARETNRQIVNVA